MKRVALVLSLILSFVFAACLKNNAGIETRCYGTVVDLFTGQPAVGVSVTVTDGSHNGNITYTDDDGSFSVNVTAQQLHDNYYLIFSADSLYRSDTIPLDGINYGLKEYNLQTIQLEGAVLPQVTTDVVSGITTVSAVCGGTITDDGRSAICRRGVCWNTSSNPTVVNTHSDAGSGNGHFVVSITGLQVGVTYYVRAYAVNSVGIAYGQEVQFTTSDGKPTVVTGAVTNVTNNAIYCGGTVVADNGNTVTHRGICYSATALEPTLNDNITNDGIGIGDFTSHITGLQSGTTYYLRAYATNAIGTSYGETKSVTTL